MKLSVPVIKCSADTIYTMRHFESEGNARGLDDQSLVSQANHMFPITEIGRLQCRSSKSYVSDNFLIGSETGLYTTGFYRAQQSMEGVLDSGKNLEVVLDHRLDEWWKGIFHSLPKEIIEQDYRHEKRIQEREGWHHYRPPQGQSGKDVEINLLSFLGDVQEKEIFIVGHGRSFGFLRRILTNQPLDFNCDYPIPKNGEIWKFAREKKHYKFESLFIPKIYC